MARMDLQRWTVGRATITAVVEQHYEHVPPRLLYPGVEPADVARHPWLVPTYADVDGRLSLAIQAFVVELHGRKVLVDPCVGNGKKLAIDYWSEQAWPFMERFAEAGFDPEQVAVVVHTHLHADHVGWDTRLEDGGWIPTFPRARHLYTQAELDYCKRGDNPAIAGVYGESVEPIVRAGLADVVDDNAVLGDGLRLEATPGHTPGHVSLWVESAGEVALLTGDFLHHPVQCAEPSWYELGDADIELARVTRARMLARCAETGALVLGAHFSAPAAGRVRSDGPAFRFVPVS